MENNTKKKQWTLLGNFLSKRTSQPLGNPKYVLYFIFIIILVGSFGLFYDLMKIDYCFSCGLDSEKVKSFAYNMTNISLSLITASVIDLIFISKKNIEENDNVLDNSINEYQNIKGNVRFFGLSSLILSFILWILVNDLLVNDYLKLILAICSLFFSYWIWWISNVKNKILSEVIQSALATIGGLPPTSPISSIITPPNVDEVKNNNLSGNIEPYKS